MFTATPMVVFYNWALAAPQASMATQSLFRKVSSSVRGSITYDLFYHSNALVPDSLPRYVQQFTVYLMILLSLPIFPTSASFWSCLWMSKSAPVRHKLRHSLAVVRT